MAIKVLVKEDKIYGGKIIFTDNCVTDQLIEAVREVLKTDKEVRVSFDVMGETKHLLLSNELRLKLRDISEDYDAEIGRYKCRIVKVK